MSLIRKGRLVGNSVLPVVCLTMVAIYGFYSLRIYTASRFAQRVDQVSLQSAIDLEPRNADYHDLLGRFLLFEAHDPATAIGAIKAAVSLNSYNAAYWLDLAQADLAFGANQEAQLAIDRAIAADPTTPDTAWNAANLFVFQGDIQRALPQYSIVLKYSPQLVPVALNQTWQIVHDANEILPLLPSDPGVYLQFLHLLVSEKDTEAAGRVWSALSQSNEHFDFHDALFYVDYLIQQHEVDRAVNAWKDLVSKWPELKQYQDSGSLIVNGKFSGDILNAGLDWHYTPMPGVTVTLDTNESPGSGAKRSILISYGGFGSDSGFYQNISVEPNTSYDFSAAVKSDNLQTANGPVVSIEDAYTHSPFAMTDETLNTTDWHEIRKDFQTGPATQLVQVRILRNPANTAIRGRFWVDDFSLHSIQFASTAASK